MRPESATRSNILYLFGQGNLNLVRKKSGNFEKCGLWQPCLRKIRIRHSILILVVLNCDAIVLVVYLDNTFPQTFVVQLEQLIIGHDNKGQDPAWYLDEVDVDIPVRDERYKFRYGGWIGGDRPGQRKEAVLFPGILSMRLAIFLFICCHLSTNQNRR